MKPFVLLITLCLCGQACSAYSAEPDPNDPRFLAVPGSPSASPTGNRDLNDPRFLAVPIGRMSPARAASSSPSPIGGVETNGVALPEAAMPLTPLDDRQKLGPEDRVTYRVIEDQDEPHILTVTDSGEVDVPYLGLVRATGKTSQQLAKEVKA